MHAQFKVHNTFDWSVKLHRPNLTLFFSTQLVLTASRYCDNKNSLKQKDSTNGIIICVTTTKHPHGLPLTGFLLLNPTTVISIVFPSGQFKDILQFDAPKNSLHSAFQWLQTFLPVKNRLSSLETIKHANTSNFSKFQHFSNRFCAKYSWFSTEEGVPTFQSAIRTGSFSAIFLSQLWTKMRVCSHALNISSLNRVNCQWINYYLSPWFFKFGFARNSFRFASAFSTLIK